MNLLRLTKIGLYVLLAMFWVVVYPAQAQYSKIYEDSLNKVRSSLHRGEYREALIYLKAAQAAQPESVELAPYLNIIKRALEQRLEEKTLEKTVKKTEEIIDEEARSKSRQKSSDQEFIAPLEKQTLSSKSSLSADRQKSAAQAAVQDVQKDSGSKPASIEGPSKKQIVLKGASQTKVSSQKEKPRFRNIIELDEGAWSLQPNTEIELPLDQDIIFRSKEGIVRFLIISPDVIEATRLGSKEILMVPVRYGRTFIHVWDAEKRWTFYLKTLFPSELRERAQAEDATREKSADSFRFLHNLSWNSFSRGPSFSDLKRQSLNFRNHFSLLGPTPYGDFDGYLVSYKTDTESTEITDYSMGLTGAEWKNFKDIEFRLFDMSRYISDLTLPGRDFRGVLLDATTRDDQFSFVALRGEDQASFGSLSPALSSSRDSYFEALQLAYHPEPDKQITANYARAWGDERISSGSTRVFSGEYEQTFDRWNFFSEVGYDENEYAELVGLRYVENDRSLFAKIRNVPRDYATVVGPTGNQGEVGTEFSYRHTMGETDLTHYLDLYRDRDNKNPEDEQALNVDFNSTYRKKLSDADFLHGNIYFIRTPGLLSDRQDFRLSNTFSHRFKFFHFPNAQLAVTGGYQRNRSDSSPSSDYDRTNLGANFSLPINRHWTYTAGYEAYYVNDVSIDEKAYPSVFSTSLTFNRRFSDQWRFNTSAYYRDEQKTEDIKSFLAGQDSLSVSSNLTYSPKAGIHIYLDGRVRDVWAENDRSEAYMEADIRLGVQSEWDLGYSWNPTGIVQGFVFRDLNQNGVKDAEEAGIPGVCVKVGEQDVITDGDGWYYAEIQAASAVVSLDLDTIPTGYVFQDVASFTFDIKHKHYYDGNFALTTESGIYGVVYYDENENKRPDNGDEFLYKVRMVLDGENAVTTDSKGAYFFYNIPEGKHTLLLDLNSLPMEFLPMVPLKNDIQVAEGTTYIFHIPVKKKNPAN